MPRLPGVESLGGVPSARSGRPIATVDTSAIGEGMPAFGRAVQDVAADLQAHRDQTATFDAERRLQEFMFNERKLATDAIANIPPGAPGGFSQPYDAGFTERANRFAEENFRGLNPETVHQLNGRLITLRQQLFFDTADAERAEIRRYNIDALDDVLSTLKNQIDIGGHTTLETYQAEGARLIEASALSPVDKVEALENWNEGAARTAWLAHLRDDPQGAIQALGFEPTPGAEYRIAGDVRGRANQAYDAFIEYGYTPAQAAGIVGNLVQESGVQPSGAVGDAGTAFGLAQWRGERFEALKRFAAERGKDWTDFQTQIAFIDHELRTSEAGAGGRLRAAQTVEEAAAAFIGFERPQGWTAANPRAGHGWGNRLAAAQTIAGDPTTSVRMIDPQYQAISSEERERLMSEAAPIIRQRRTAYAEDMTNYAAYLRAGNAPTDAYDPQEAQSILGPEGAALLEQGLGEAAREGQTIRAVAFATPDELRAATEAMSLRLANDPENFIENEKEATRLAAAIEERNKHLVGPNADPAAYVLQQSTVGTAYDALAQALTSDDPSAVEAAPGLANAYAVASLNEQARLGVPEDQRTILSKAHRDSIVASFADQEEGGQNAAQLMRGLQQQWGRHWPQVFKELSEGGDLPGVALVVGTMDRPEQSVAAERLAEAAIVGIAELEKTVASDVAKGPGSINEGLFNVMQPFANSVLGLPGGQNTLSTFNEAVHLLALSYAQQGESASSALTKAFNDVLGGTYEFRDGYRVPRPYSSAQVAEGTRYLMGTLATLPLDVENVTGLSPEEARRQYASSLQAFGSWRTNEDETGLTLYNQAGRAVTVNGQPLTASWNDLMLAEGLTRGDESPVGRLGEAVGRAIGEGLGGTLPPATPLREALDTALDIQDEREPAPLYSDAEQLDIITRARDLFWAGQLTEAEFRQTLEDAGISWDDRGRTR